MKDLLSVDVAQARILAAMPLPQTEAIQTEASQGRVLAAAVEAPIDLPPFANSSMDGFAVRTADVLEAGVRLQVVMDIPAGVAPSGTLAPGEAARIMTGAPVPPGADAVIPVEQTDATWEPESQIRPGEIVEIRTQATPGQNIRQVGENIRMGAQVLTEHTRLRPQDIGMLLGLGVIEVTVYQQPRVAILSTGDELIAPWEPLTPGKIRDTNSYTIAGMVWQAGGEPVRLLPAKDTIADVRRLFNEALAQEPDIVISTAGVSVGSFDVVRTVLDELGEIGFWRVNVRPGKPLAFGKIAGVPFFGLPGNPVSAMVTFDLFVRPALQYLQGLPQGMPTIRAETGEVFTSDGRRTYARVRLHTEHDRVIATATGTQSSGALMSMVLADGLMIIPEGEKTVPKGTRLEVRLLRDLNFAL
jgi:molybdopterin molybdotransferase